VKEYRYHKSQAIELRKKAATEVDKETKEHLEDLAVGEEAKQENARRELAYVNQQTGKESSESPMEELRRLASYRMVRAERKKGNVKA
jgi:hypothetical protein